MNQTLTVVMARTLAGRQEGNEPQQGTDYSDQSSLLP